LSVFYFSYRIYNAPQARIARRLLGLKRYEEAKKHSWAAAALRRVDNDEGYVELDIA
jgi:hypothetical protein